MTGPKISSCTTFMSPAGSRRSASARRSSPGRASRAARRRRRRPPSARPCVDVALDPISMRAVMTGPSTVSGLVGIADLQHLRHLREAGDDLVVDPHGARSRVSARCRSGPSGTSTPSRSCRTAVFTLASSNTSAAALAAELEQQALHRAPAHLGDAHADPVDPVNDTMSMSRVSTSASPVAGVDPVTHVDDAGREADLVQDAHELDDRERVLRRGPHAPRCCPSRSVGPSLPAMFTIGKL